MLSSRLVYRWIISTMEKGDTKSHYIGHATYSRLSHQPLRRGKHLKPMAATINAKKKDRINGPF